MKFLLYFFVPFILYGYNIIYSTINKPYQVLYIDKNIKNINNLYIMQYKKYFIITQNINNKQDLKNIKSKLKNKILIFNSNKNLNNYILYIPLLKKYKKISTNSDFFKTLKKYFTNKYPNSYKDKYEKFIKCYKNVEYKYKGFTTTSNCNFIFPFKYNNSIKLLNFQNSYKLIINDKLYYETNNSDNSKPVNNNIIINNIFMQENDINKKEIEINKTNNKEKNISYKMKEENLSLKNINKKLSFKKTEINDTTIKSKKIISNVIKNNIDKNISLLEIKSQKIKTFISKIKTSLEINNNNQINSNDTSKSIETNNISYKLKLNNQENYKNNKNLYIIILIFIVIIYFSYKKFLKQTKSILNNNTPKLLEHKNIKLENNNNLHQDIPKKKIIIFLFEKDLKEILDNDIKNYLKTKNLSKKIENKIISSNKNLNNNIETTNNEKPKINKTIEELNENIEIEINLKTLKIISIKKGENNNE